MVLTVEETHDRYRIQVDADELGKALDAYVHDLGAEATSALGIGPEEQAELFKEFVDDVLSGMKISSDHCGWPDQFWRAAVQRTSERSLELQEVQVSLSSKRVYFWGCEIGHLIQQGSLRFQFEPEQPIEYPDGA